MTNGWTTRRTIVTESTDPRGRTLVGKDDVSHAGEFLLVPPVEEMTTETRDARVRFLALIDTCAAVCGGEVARDLEDAAVGVEANIRLEVIARLLAVASALESDYRIFVRTPEAAAAPVECPSPLPEWQMDRMVRWRGRRILAALAGAFVAGLAVRSVVGRLV